MSSDNAPGQKEARSTRADLALSGLLSEEEYAALAEEVRTSIAAEKKRNRREGKRQISGRLPRELLTSADQYVARYADEIQHAAAVLAPTQPHLAVALTLLAQIVSDDDPTTTEQRQTMPTQQAAPATNQAMDIDATLSLNDEIEGLIGDADDLLADGLDPMADGVAMVSKTLPRVQRIFSRIKEIREEMVDRTPDEDGEVAKRWIDTGTFVRKRFNI